jgi:hypothetical protein
MKERENEYTNKLKKADNWDEVIKLQAQIEMIDIINAKVKGFINNKNNELIKQSENRQ